MTFRVIDKLGINAAVASENRKPRAARGALHFLPDPQFDSFLSSQFGHITFYLAAALPAFLLTNSPT